MTPATPTTLATQQQQQPQPQQQFNALAPVITPTQAKQYMQTFNQIKESILTEDDWCTINGKRCITRKGIRKFAYAFGLTDEITNEQRINREDDSFVWYIKVQVTAPNKQTSIGVGACDSREKHFSHPEHDVWAIAHTRAKNRATLDMIGGGLDNITSSEELTPSNTTTAAAIDAEYQITPTPTTTPTAAASTPAMAKTLQTEQEKQQQTPSIINNWVQDKYRKNIEICTNTQDPKYQNVIYALSDPENSPPDIKLDDGYTYSKYTYKGTPCIQRTKETPRQ